MSEDPKRDAGMKKAPLHLLPTVALRVLAAVLGLGAKKYGEWNWRESEGVRVSTYKGAIMRHLFSVCEGEWTDPESGQPHLGHIMACCALLIDAQAHGKLIHDEPDAFSGLKRMTPAQEILLANVEVGMMTEGACGDCKHHFCPVDEQPCAGCHRHSRWEAPYYD